MGDDFLFHFRRLGSPQPQLQACKKVWEGVCQLLGGGAQLGTPSDRRGMGPTQDSGSPSQVRPPAHKDISPWPPGLPLPHSFLSAACSLPVWGLWTPENGTLLVPRPPVCLCWERVLWGAGESGPTHFCGAHVSTRGRRISGRQSCPLERPGKGWLLPTGLPMGRVQSSPRAPALPSQPPHTLGLSTSFSAAACREI